MADCPELMTSLPGYATLTQRSASASEFATGCTTPSAQRLEGSSTPMLYVSVEPPAGLPPQVFGEGGGVVPPVHLPPLHAP